VRVQGPPPVLRTRPRPAGSIDTGDATALLMLRNRRIDDTNAYTYDCGRPDQQGGYARDERTWFNRETIGVYATPPATLAATEVQAAWRRAQLVLADFVPAQVRLVLVLEPGIDQEVYDSRSQVVEAVR
jgi:hypothetical protein